VQVKLVTSCLALLSVVLSGCSSTSVDLDKELKSEIVSRGVPFKAEMERLMNQGKKPGISEAELTEVLNKMEEVAELSQKSMEQFQRDWNLKHPTHPLSELPDLRLPKR
jgi:hypothetical protein